MHLTILDGVAVALVRSECAVTFACSELVPIVNLDETPWTDRMLNCSSFSFDQCLMEILARSRMKWSLQEDCEFRTIRFTASPPLNGVNDPILAVMSRELLRKEDEAFRLHPRQECFADSDQNLGAQGDVICLSRMGDSLNVVDGQVGHSVTGSRQFDRRGVRGGVDASNPRRVCGQLMIARIRSSRIRLVRLFGTPLALLDSGGDSDRSCASATSAFTRSHRGMRQGRVQKPEDTP